MKERRGVDTTELLRSIERYRVDKLHRIQTGTRTAGEVVLSAHELEKFVSNMRRTLEETEARQRIIMTLVDLKLPRGATHVLRLTGGLGVAFFCGEYLQGADTLEDLSKPLELVCPLCKERVVYRFESYEVNP